MRKKYVFLIVIFIISIAITSLCLDNDKKSFNKSKVDYLQLRELAPTEDKIHFLDVGTADAILLESVNNNGDSIYGLIDTGSGNDSSRNNLKNYLNKLSIDTLEFVLITHFHSDHYGGLTPLLDNYNVKKVYIKKYNGYNSEKTSTVNTEEEIINDRNSKVRLYNSYINRIRNSNIDLVEINDENQNDAASQGTSFGHFTLAFYNRADRLKSFVTQETDYCLLSKNCSENVNTIVVYGEIFNTKIYFAGDIENLTVYTDETKTNVYQQKNAEDEISESVKNTKLNTGNNYIDIYKASHHGYVNNNTATAVNNLNPKHAVVTNSLETYNRYSSPIFPRSGTDPANISYLNNLCRKTNGNMYVTGISNVVVSINNDGTYSFNQSPIGNCETYRVSGVQFSKTEVTVPTKGTFNISTITEVLPSNASDKYITWTSSDPSIATIDSTGLITAKTTGNTTITATTEDGNFTATCRINVEKAKCQLTSEAYNIDNERLTITEVDINDSEETIKSNIKCDCGEVTIDENKVLLKIGDAYLTYSIVRGVVVPDTGFSMIYLIYLGIIFLIAGAAVIIIVKNKKTKINQEL